MFVLGINLAPKPKTYIFLGDYVWLYLNIFNEQFKRKILFFKKKFIKWREY